VEFNLISDVPGDNVASVLDEPSYGFSLLWMKHTAGSLFDGGIDVGFQPLGGLDTTFTVDVGGEAREADLVLRNQLAHAHYVLRTTLFPTKKVQPYAEVFGGIRGAFLGTTLRIEGQSAREIDTQIPGTDFNFSYGYAGGVRLQLGERTCLNVRYAQMLHFEGDDAIEIIDMSDLVVDGDDNVTVGDRNRGTSGDCRARRLGHPAGKRGQGRSLTPCRALGAAEIPLNGHAWPPQAACVPLAGPGQCPPTTPTSPPRPTPRPPAPVECGG